MTEQESIEQFESLALAELAAEEEAHEQGDETHLCELDEALND